MLADNDCVRSPILARCLFSVTVCLASHSALAQNNVCPNDGSGEDAFVCAKQGADAADAKLSETYQHALTQLSGSDNLERAKTSLIESERAWVKFRDADCVVQDRLFEQGSMRRAMVEMCLQSHSEQRTRDLQNMRLP
ncbi:lysozyme inhibitor LprI family protein [Dyella sp. Tek66A03]|uniref:lysozyme inhibitor LprI family protein n=1 Tax=Dyella sp. Tek66A03 TaxID=3458298 RepID=UPI00403EC0FA